MSRWFLEPARRGDDALVDRLRAGALRDDEPRVGVLHAANERDDRGGFSLYVPEQWDGRAGRCRWWWRSTAATGMAATFCGAGCARRARGACSSGAHVAGPHVVDHGREDVDAERLRGMVESVAARYPVDRARVLLTGMSDGATYALAVRPARRTCRSPTWPRPAVCSIPLLADGGLARARGRPIYLVHGALDWMFPVETARMAREALAGRGRPGSSTGRSTTSRTRIRGTRTRASSTGSMGV